MNSFENSSSNLGLDWQEIILMDTTEFGCGEFALRFIICAENF
jgi:hypothetical protein